MDSISTPTPSGASEPKYQVKGTNPQEKPKIRQRGKGRGGKPNPKEGEKPKAVHLNTVHLEDYATHAEAAEAISFALSTYASTTPDAIKVSLINYLKK